MERTLKELSNEEIESTLSSIREELTRRKQGDKTMEKPKFKIPFQTIGKKEEPKVEAPAPVVKTEPEKEYVEQQKEMEKEQEQFMQEHYDMICRHEISMPLLLKSQFTIMVCGHCRKAIFIQNQSNGYWMPLTEEYPKEIEQ